MARIYDVVCLKCGEEYEWCKYDPPFEKCEFCGSRLSSRGNWNENAEVFGVWSSNLGVYELSKERRIRFFEEKGEAGFRFRTKHKKWCTIRLKEYPEFRLNFNVKGERVTLVCDNPKLSEVVASLREYGKMPEGSITAVIYRGELYSSAHPAAKMILRAVETGEKPEVVAVVDC